MKKILLVSFDFIKESYGETTYSIATILSSLKSDKKLDVEVEHYGVNLSKIYKDADGDLEKINKNVYYKFWSEIKQKIYDYDFIAIGVSTWSNIYVDYFLKEILSDYTGKIILGGYEVTALDKDSLERMYPSVSYFIKGYSETALKKIIRNEYSSERIICERLEPTDLSSSYTTGILSLDKKKVHWETKRGCPFSCGFCEWGNAAEKKVFPINFERIMDEVHMFRDSNVEEINILDGTFNFGKDYIKILRIVLSATSAKVTMQARFESIHGKEGDEFLDLCSRYKDRVKLELGLQTIHELEMILIGRKNDLEKVDFAMMKLNNLGINYEVSLIYGIPGQTSKTFEETIEFVLSHGCNNVRAFPLRIPKNSKMEKMKASLGIKERPLDYNVDQVTSCFSFDEEDYKKMEDISNDLYEGNIRKYFIFEESNPHEWKLKNVQQANSLVLYSNESCVRDLDGASRELIKTEYNESEITKRTISKENIHEDKDAVKELLKFAGGKILDYAVDRGTKYLRDKAIGKPNLKKVIDVVDDVYKSNIWKHKDSNGTEYKCKFKMTDNGNFFVFHTK